VAGSVHPTVTGLPPTTGFGLAVTTIAFHTAKFVETDMVEGLTLILTVGVPLMWGVLGQARVWLPLAKVHPLMTWPVLSVT
jgi:hypothetical protein